MDKFLNLPKEKQDTIINAALNAFGSNGYKKTSVNDVATAAGISKAAIFHYFGTKKDLYFYLADFCSHLIVSEIEKNSDCSVTDFFDKIKLAAAVKLSVLEKHPGVFAFLNSMYFETDEEVKPKIKTILEGSQTIRERIALSGVDSSKFKEGIDPDVVLKMLVRLAEGVVSEMTNPAGLDVAALTQDFYEYMELIRKNFYKEEYLT